MKRVDRILAVAREEADNEDPTATSGISNAVALSWVNEAQDTAQVQVAASYVGLISDTRSFNTTADDEDYLIHNRLFLNNKLKLVSLSATGDAQDLKPIYPTNPYGKSLPTGQPSSYDRRNKQLLLYPIPNSATYLVKVEFEREADDLDIRRGLITSVTGLGTVASPITAIVLSAANPDPDTAGYLDDILPGDYICVVDKDGVRQSYNLPVSAYSSGTNTLTITNFVMDTDAGDTLPAANDYVTLGRYTTTHSELPDAFEVYLQRYVTWKFLSKDGDNEKSVRYERSLDSLLKNIINGLVASGEELKPIPVLGEQIDLAEW